MQDDTANELIGYWDKSDQELKEMRHRVMHLVLARPSHGTNTNTIVRYGPVIQMISQELTERQSTRMSKASVLIATLALIVSATSLIVSAFNNWGP